MKSVLTLLCLSVVAHHVAAQCRLKAFDTTFLPACDANDLYIKWPNYADQTTYYSCNGMNNPVVVPCPKGEFFIYVMQQCGACNDYIPPVQCSQLKTQNPPDCRPLTGVPGLPGAPTDQPGLPTPNYPNSTTTTGKPTKEPTTPKTTTEKTTKPTAPTPPSGGPTPPTGGPTPPTPPSNTDIPPPPSPSTNEPGVPMPPTPEPTPPSVSVEPPYVTQAPSQ